MLVFEVLVIESLAINLDELFAEITVEFSIENVGHGFRLVAGGASRPVVQQLDYVFIEKHCLKTRTDRKVLKPHPWFSGTIVSWFLTIGERTMVQLLVRASKAAADFDTTV